MKKKSKYKTSSIDPKLVWYFGLLFLLLWALSGFASTFSDFSKKMGSLLSGAAGTGANVAGTAEAATADLKHVVAGADGSAIVGYHVGAWTELNDPSVSADNPFSDDYQPAGNGKYLTNSQIQPFADTVYSELNSSLNTNWDNIVGVIIAMPTTDDVAALNKAVDETVHGIFSSNKYNLLAQISLADAVTADAIAGNVLQKP